MIRQTFWNLSNEKREELVLVAKKEFSLRPIHEATVSNIANELGIARSSFYNYFDNLEDLYFYVLGILKNNFRQMITSNIDKNNGDIFQAYIDTFEDILSIDENRVERGIIRNLFLNSSGLIQNFMVPFPDKDEIDDTLKELNNKVNKNNLKINEGRDLLLVTKMLTDNFFQSIAHYFMYETDYEVATKEFKTKINIIKYGICKEEK